MKILGVSLGTKNGNNDTMCRVALEECQKMGAEIEFIHLFDWDIKPCTGCVACSVGLVMGKGMVCSQKDDFNAFYQKIVDADGVLMVDPIFESGGTGLYHTITDRMGPGHDSGLLLGAHFQMLEKGGQGLDMNLFKQKAISFVGIGGSDWAIRTETDHAMFALSPGWKIIDNDFFSWSKDVIMQDDKIA
ncbi:MAG: flavodoxin family protein, partial [Mogibacterium sp.]|nr:flavodoxin family protein [Mogibacterium sp.]